MNYVVLFALVTVTAEVLLAVDGACNLQKATQSRKCVVKEATDAQSAFMSKDKAKVCELGKKLAECGAYLMGCSKKDVDLMNAIVKPFNSHPFNCSITLGASGVTAAVVTIVLAAAAAFIMK